MILFDPSGTRYQLGIDGVSLWLVWLVNIVMAIVILTQHQQLILVLIVLIFIGFWSIAVFVVLDLLLFYISFEGVLIPMFFLIGWYGGRNRKIHAAYQLFLYTLFGSLFLFLALILVYLETGTTDYQV
jgi:NADH-ubiquinone oxidoreductase chain 4